MDSVSATVTTVEDEFTNTITVTMPVDAQSKAVDVLGVAIAKAVVASWGGSITNAIHICQAALDHASEMR